MCRRCYRRWWCGESSGRPWSKRHQCCVRCGENSSRHAADGVCNRCWQQERAGSDEAKAKAREYQQKYHSIERGRAIRRDYAARDYVRERKWLDRIRRREVLAGVWMPLPSGYVERAFKIFEGRCVRCGAVERLELDHHQPLGQGHALLGNSVVLCRSCNAMKHASCPEAFYDRWTLVIIAVRLMELREWLHDQAAEVSC